MNRNIRIGQLLSPFGIGQLVNFPNDETLMICGLDFWDIMVEQRIQNAGIDHIDLTEFEIREPRLEKLLGVEKFLKPFPFRENSRRNSNLKIPAVRFPQWHYCIKCGIMHKIQLTRQGQETPTCSSRDCRGKLIPVRFVSLCRSGHIQDFPFMEWVHSEEFNDNEEHILRYSAGKGSGDLSSIIIECSCSAKRSLSGIMNEGALNKIGTCGGHRPWLGPQGISEPQNCENPLRVVIRGASNVHYSHIKSALFLPKTEKSTPEVVNRIIERNGDTLREFYELDNDGKMLETFLKTQPEIKLKHAQIEETLEYIINFIESDNETIDGSSISSDFDIRAQEYKYLNTGRDSENSDFKAIVNKFSDTKEGKFLSEFFEHVVLIEKLRETRVFSGFSRIDSEDGRSLENRINDLSLKQKKWLPAHVVYGEGIFLKFNDQKIDKWLERAPNSTLKLLSRFQSKSTLSLNQDETRDLSPAFVLIHTFSHLLINRLCYKCGYGSSSLRERIYYSSNEQEDTRMNGVLIYTSSGDSEGSMGGLVRQGREFNLYHLIKEVIEDARWCSADPVCIDVGSQSGQGPDSLNGAACHNCAIVPETSCEEFNKLLDRSCLTGDYESPESGYFYQ